ncbi:MAG: VCBS repeat-containing protein [Candidatus Latescibacterota bacterium]
MAPILQFSEHLVMGGFGYAYGICAADLDGDGNLDLVASDTDVGLYWFANDGRGRFTRHVIHSRTGEWLERHAVADIDGDGRPEIVIVDNIGGSVLYFRCQGDPREASNWVQHYLDRGGLPGAYDVAVADLDGDGDLDVAASSWRKGNQFVWYENRQGEWVKHVVEEGIGETRTLCAADVNGDGRTDLVGTACTGNQVVWYENPGDPSGRPWIKHLVDTAPGPSHGHPVDMDGDGDADIVMALGAFGPYEPGAEQVVWYENDGEPGRGLWRKHVVCASFPRAFEAVAADLDGDGQVEVVATAWGEPGRVALFRHQGDPRGPWTQQVLKEGWTRANQVIVADLDGDGRLDIVAAAERGSNEVRWWRNEGAGPAPRPSVRVTGPQPYPLGSRLELFVDRELIAGMVGLGLQLHAPRLAEIAVARDRPYEDSTLYDPVVMLDEGRYRLWYRTNFNQAPFYTGYAESTDGVQWTKPSLGLVEFAGSTDNNLVWSSAMGPGQPCVLSVFKDPGAACPEDQRYRAVCLVHHGGKPGLCAMGSPDGLRWRLLRPEPVLTQGAFDSHNIAFHDAARGCYTAYYRDFVDGVRHIRRGTSPDFLQWKDDGFIDLGEGPLEHLYKNAATPYYRRPDLVLMFPKRFVETRTPVPEWPHPGVSDLLFMSSRDGFHFRRTFLEAFLRPGLDHLNWHERAIEAGQGLVPTGPGEMSLYVVEHYRTEQVRIRRAVLREDGIASLHAGHGGGEMTTRPLLFAGSRLVLNYSTSAAGSVRVELQDGSGRPLPGRELSRCPEIYGDEIERVVAWESGPEVGQWAGTPVRLRMVLQDADVFSFAFRE